MLVAAGETSSGFSNSAEVYDPASNTWSAAANLNFARFAHTATLLPSGKVLVAGGGTSGVQNNAELFDPTLNAWNLVGSLPVITENHIATLLPSGKVLVTGGTNTVSPLSSAEIFDPATNTWTAAGSLTNARYRHTATLLPSGKVLASGGYGAIGYTASAELGDDGLQYQAASRPAIVSATSPLQVQTPMSLTGTLFTGISEASGGATNNSASNNPFIVLQSLANEQVRYLRPDPANPWTASSYTSLPVAPLNPGYALLTVIVNGIPSPSSIIQINNPAGVTPATITSFSARAEGAGVVLEWNAVSEFQNAGFHVYRRSTDGQKWTHVDSSLIAGRITNADRKTYQVYDWPDPGVYDYRLETVSIDGKCESYRDIAGPAAVDAANVPSITDGGLSAAISSTANLAVIERSQDLSAKFATMSSAVTRHAALAAGTNDPGHVSGIQPARARETANSNTPPAMSPTAGVRWFSASPIGAASSFTAAKVSYSTPGVLMIPQSMLPPGFDAKHVAIQREGVSLTALAQTPVGLIVYGAGYSDDYTDKDALFLRSITGATASGVVTQAHDLFAGTQPVCSTSQANVTVTYHDVYFDYNYRPYNFAPWFSSQYLTGGSDQTFTVATPNASGDGATLTVNLYSLPSSDDTVTNHALQVLVNSQPIGQAQWNSSGVMMQLTFQVPSGVLNAGANQVDLITPTANGDENLISFLYSMAFSYTRTLDGSHPVTIASTVTTPSVYELNHVTSANVWVVDARFPDRAALVPYESQLQTDGTYKIRFIGTGGGTGQFLVVPAGQESLPIAVTKAIVKPVISTPYMAVGPSQFGPGVQPLLLMRSKEGLRASFVDQEQVFDYYNYGRYGPTAIQNAVQSTLPQYLLLLGRTTCDYHNYSGANVDPLCPTFLVPTTFWAQATSDSTFGDLGRGYSEVAIGRLPVNNTSELSVAIEHIMSYSGAPNSGVRVHAVADQADPAAADFPAQAAALAQSFPDMTWQPNYYGVTYQTLPEVSAAMTVAANGGADWILYIGHGNAAHLGQANETILDTDSVQAWTGNVVFLQSTCTGNWMAKDEPDYKSVAIQALTQPQGGISASIGTSTYMVSDYAVAFMNQLMKNANSSGARWGSALMKTQQWAHAQSSLSNYYQDLSKTEQIFGDPAMPVLQKSAPAGTMNSGSTPSGTGSALSKTQAVAPGQF